ncbi:hypothetical protein Rleg5DRAFT_1570 [Rhizobium leguminosarum bv. viciae WSM1455]|nr:hypothetical protein Rleg5DRAFT_1570 [Rhizobium leguminosarum bv. viciae WSM1455]
MAGKTRSRALFFFDQLISLSLLWEPTLSTMNG